ncbi:MAG: family 78 glycoside hydrolase catalytic domain, partial [Planctomycetota bacterium]
MPTPVDLCCNRLCNPLGIEDPSPRLSWRLDDDRDGAAQTAYRIEVARTPEALDTGTADLWDSGWVASNRSLDIAYAGEPLGSGARAWWRVTVRDHEEATSAPSAAAFWEIGLPAADDWRGAAWIESGLTGSKYASAPCPYLRKAFTVPGPVHRARLAVSALGLYEARLNGARVGDAELAPGFTDYRTRVQYQVYDVTDAICEGDNAIGAILGDGWYCGHLAWLYRQAYGPRPRFLARLLVETEAGETVVVTDESWRWNTGAIIESDLLMGEQVDARLTPEGWDSPGFDDSAWPGCRRAEVEGVALSPVLGPPVRRTETLTPVADPVLLRRESCGYPVYRYDFGQNLAGRVRLTVTANESKPLRLRHAEMLDADGALYTANLRTARATDSFVCRGTGAPEVFEPRFTFHGFRYVEVAGPVEPGDLALEAVVLHSDTPRLAVFRCDDERINRLVENADWSQRGNFIDIPTDCPQRDERMGWTGDALVFARTAAISRNLTAFFRKWIRDLADVQSDAGAIPMYAPDPQARGDLDKDGGPCWADAIVFCPWTVYEITGDAALLADAFPAMTRFVDWLERTSTDGVRTPPDYEGWAGFGDWLAPGEPDPGRAPTLR